MKKKLLALSVLTAISTQANAFQFDTSDDWEIRWDNTFKFNAMFRTSKIDKDVITNRYSAAGERSPGAGWFVADDSDLSVDRSNLGIVSTRLDLLSELAHSSNVLLLADPRVDRPRRRIRSQEEIHLQELVAGEGLLQLRVHDLELGLGRRRQ